MKRQKIALTVTIVAFIMLFFTGCSDKALGNAIHAMDAYDRAVERYNKSIAGYNMERDRLIRNNALLEGHIVTAEEAISRGEEPANPKTLEALKDAIAAAEGRLVPIPELLEEVLPMNFSDNMKKEELEEITKRATAKAKALEAAVLPEIPEIPDYKKDIALIEEAIAAYEKSIAATEFGEFKNFAFPSDEFVMERLQRVDTIIDMAPIVEGYDPSGDLNENSDYIGCIYFIDSQVRYTLDQENVINNGIKGGGSIEIYDTAKDAFKRDGYLTKWEDTGMIGSHQVVGTLIVRTSYGLTKAQRQELTDKIIAAIKADE